MSPEITWKSHYAVGHETIDEDHQHLFKLLNILQRAIHSNLDNYNIVKKALENLLDYTRHHFKTEEELMRQHQYSDYESHRAEHENLIDRVEELQSEFNDGEVILCDEVIMFLKEWLLDHIANEDTKLAACVEPALA